MRGLFTQSFDRGERSRLAGLFGSIGALHLVGWGLLLAYGANHPGFIWLGGVAYMLGLRHAFDADHISAIDNTTRKLLQSGKKPLGVGFFFSLGHSSIVFGLTAALAVTAGSLQSTIPALQSYGGYVGASVSGTFLWII